MKLSHILSKLFGTSVASSQLDLERRILPLEEAEMIPEEPHIYCAQRGCGFEIFHEPVFYCERKKRFYHVSCTFPGIPAPQDTPILNYHDIILSRYKAAQHD